MATEDLVTRDDAAARRPRLSRERVLAAAMALADRDGLEALTIRALAEDLGTKPMTLYHHVAGKEALLDGIADQVFAEMELPPEDLEWRDAIRVRCRSAREVLARRPWSVPLLESRRHPGPSLLAHHEAVLATLARGGLSIPLMAHAYAVLDSFIYGFAIQEANLPVQGGEESAEVAAKVSAAFDPELYPTLVRFTVEHAMRPDYSFGASFDYGLDLILDGLERAAREERA
ncbi:TetR/AcrR family transcriptional regulator C-terminal domain-containing protein [Demequina silvatica]|uniref:TetR/AcrR family transcriptional regulator C-terminal domain-containing protein n=1 Tax=Demequina silvatica TaxID=1638988 RepID=UPI000780959C|nr:TetR/AcrR family transcriptional regulator C-terminal domain-containing protein [Demequina silvatica]